MTFKKPSSEVAFATGIYIIFGIYGTYLGFLESSHYMMVMCPLVAALSLGVWFQSKAAAVVLILISIFFVGVGSFTMATGHFSVHLLLRVIVQVYTTLVLWLWVRGVEV